MNFTHIKKLFFTTLLVSTSAFADQVILSQNTVSLNVDISTTKIKLSQADYSSPVVKVLVPDLADVTFLNHRNTAEGAPCLATYDTLKPQDVIQDNPVVEKIDFTITLEKSVYSDVLNKVCKVSLTERVEGKIRGFSFGHTRTLAMPERHIDDCR